VVDIGCGYSPYKQILKKYGCKKYLGLDNFAPLKPDILSDSWRTGLKEKSVDVVISTFSLEHTIKFNETISEANRILKKGGVFMAAIPFCHNEHGQPDDFYRFSQYYYKSSVFLGDKWNLVSIESSNGYLSTLSFLFISLIKSFPSNSVGKIVNAPIIALLNITSLFLDFIFRKITLKSFVNLYESLPIAYYVTVNKK
jgi:hypothetical protein